MKRQCEPAERSAGAWQGNRFNFMPSERSQIMRKLMSVGALVLAVVVGMITVPVSAQEVSKTILLKRDTTIGGQVLPKGEYELKYAAGKDELVIVKGNREVLTATYKVAKLEKTPSVTSVFYSQEADGSYQLKRIEFRGTAAALTFENTVAKAISR